MNENNYHPLENESVSASLPQSTILTIEPTTENHQQTKLDLTQLKNWMTANFESESQLINQLLKNHNHITFTKAMTEVINRKDGWNFNQALSSEKAKIYQKVTPVNVEDITTNLTSNLIITPTKVTWQTSELYNDQVILVSREINFINDQNPSQMINQTITFIDEKQNQLAVFSHEPTAFTESHLEQIKTQFCPDNVNVTIETALKLHQFTAITNLTTKPQFGANDIINWFLGFSTHIAATACLEYGKIWAHSKLAIASRSIGALNPIIMPILNFDMKKLSQENWFINTIVTQTLNGIFLTATLLETIAFNIGKLSDLNDQIEGNRNFFKILNWNNIKTIFFNNISSFFTGEQIIGAGQIAFNTINTIYQNFAEKALISNPNLNKINLVLSSVREGLIVTGFSLLAKNIANDTIPTSNETAKMVGLIGTGLVSYGAIKGLSTKLFNLGNFVYNQCQTLMFGNQKLVNEIKQLDANKQASLASLMNHLKLDSSHNCDIDLATIFHNSTVQIEKILQSATEAAPLPSDATLAMKSAINITRHEITNCQASDLSNAEKTNITQQLISDFIANFNYPSAIKGDSEQKILIELGNLTLSCALIEPWQLLLNNQNSITEKHSYADANAFVNLADIEADFKDNDDTEIFFDSESHPAWMPVDGQIFTTETNSNVVFSN